MVAQESAPAHNDLCRAATLGQFLQELLHLLQRVLAKHGVDAGIDLGLGEERQVILGAEGHIGPRAVVVEIVRLALEDAAEALQMAEVQPLGATGHQVLGRLWREAMAYQEGVRTLYALDHGNAGNVEGDHRGALPPTIGAGTVRSTTTGRTGLQKRRRQLPTGRSPLAEPPCPLEMGPAPLGMHERMCGGRHLQFVPCG